MRRAQTYPMNPNPKSLLRELASHKDAELADFARSLLEFIATGDPACVSAISVAPMSGKIRELGQQAAESAWPWSQENMRIAEFGARLYLAHPVRRWPHFLMLWEGVMQGVLERDRKGHPEAAEWLLDRAKQLGFGADDVLAGLESGLWGSSFSAWNDEAEEDKVVLRWERHILDLPQAELTKALGRGGVCLLRALAAERPEIVRDWLHINYPPQSKKLPSVEEVSALLVRTSEFDPVAEGFVCSPADSVQRASVLEELMRRRPDRHRDLFLRSAREPAVAAYADILLRLVEGAPDLALEVLPAVLRGGFLTLYGVTMGREYREAYKLAFERLDSAGAAVVDALVECSDANAKGAAVFALVDLAKDDMSAPRIEALRRILRSINVVERKVEVLRKVAERHAALLCEEWRELLGSNSKQLREVAVEVLSKSDPDDVRRLGAEFVRAKRADQRIGGAALLAALEEAALAPLLQEALATEKSAAVRAELRRALEKLGCSTPADVMSERATESQRDVSSWESELARRKRAPKAPADWAEPSSLPKLVTPDGREFGQLLVTHLLATQAAHKAVTVTPEIAPLLAQLDRARSGDFALALLEAWLASPQEAKDRWALVLAGALGDTRILPVINSWIPKWCEKGRGKLAEYAAQAIALQGSDEALMFLDALATRYRSKQRNIGAAAAQAFQAAADARGLSADELGDLVVPGFGFNEDGLRDFTWEGGAARAELGVDLKLAWSDPESDKTLKGLPASAPDALRAEVKELGKLLREAAKGQTARLELALVRQRRWPVARWRELYERHPVLRAFATRLVWGIYGADGALLRCFRRYPNGLLADAAGGLEELPEAETQIGMVHPLELTADAIAAWRAHLARFKVEAPFPQLERPVERLDPLHANRRELAVAQDKTLGAGTFRSRAERRGWMRGSVVDAGGVAGYFKAFPGAGVEVSLEIDGLYIGIDPMETITLGVARFTRADSVKRGSYVYDDPQANDARVLAFGVVPPVVYSETVGDLKAIAGIGAAAGGEAGADADNDQA